MKLSKEQWIELSKQGVIDSIREYITEQIDLSQRKSRSDEAFGKAAWPYVQASELGLQKAYYKLLDFLPEKIND
jgi:hypothetical protein